MKNAKTKIHLIVRSNTNLAELPTSFILTCDSCNAAQIWWGCRRNKRDATPRRWENDGNPQSLVFHIHSLLLSEVWIWPGNRVDDIVKHNGYTKCLDCPCQIASSDRIHAAALSFAQRLITFVRAGRSVSLRRSADCGNLCTLSEQANEHAPSTVFAHIEIQTQAGHTWLISMLSRFSTGWLHDLFVDAEYAFWFVNHERYILACKLWETSIPSKRG